MTIIKLNTKTLIQRFFRLLPLNLTKKRALKENHAMKLLSIYGSMPRTMDFKFKNCQKLLGALLEKELDEKLHHTIMNDSIFKVF